MRHRLSGFTLIELMIVVVVVAILAAIALPAYQDMIRKSRRADALSQLLNVQLQQEKWRANNPRYAATAASVGMANTTYYTFSLSNIGPNTYTITATARSTGNQNQDSQFNTSCASLSINQNNLKTPADCWRK